MSNKWDGRKPLSYSNMDELEKCAKIDLKTLDFNKLAICNSLLKMLDKANDFIKERDDERAYIMLMRFFESFIELRKSRIYKEDRKFVDNFIPGVKLDQSMSKLEKIKSELKQRYQQKSSSNSKTKTQINQIYKIKKKLINYKIWLKNRQKLKTNQ